MRCFWFWPRWWCGGSVLCARWPALSVMLVCFAQVHVATDAKKAAKRDYGDMHVHRCAVRTLHHKVRRRMGASACTFCVLRALIFVCCALQFIVIDCAAVCLGSFNFVTKAFSGNCENCLAIRHPLVASTYVQQWNSIVGDAPFAIVED